MQIPPFSLDEQISEIGDEIEEAFLRRLEDDRTRGALRAASWLNNQGLENNDIDVQIKVDSNNASLSDNT